MAKVLIIDDEEIIRRRLKELLVMDAYEVFVADSGKAGLDIFKKENPEIVLVDIKMPGMDGIEVLSEVKKVSPQTEVLIITGHGGIDSAIQALRQNAFDYITKPINYDELEIAVKRALEKQRLLIENRRMQDELKKRFFELDVLYNVSSAISYTLDYQQLLKLIIESLFKIVEYDICASILFDVHTANITLKPVYAQSAVFVDEVKKSLIDSVSIVTGENIQKKRMDSYLIPSAPDVKPDKERQFDELRSFFNVPFIVHDKAVGMINVSSCKENAFSEEDIKLIYTIANQASNAIERLQAVIKAEKSKMESMVESMAEGVIMFDERGEIVVLNPQARRMFGFGPDEEIISSVLNEKMKTLSLDKTLKESQTKGILMTKEIIIHHENRNVILNSDIGPVNDKEGKIIGIVIILRDITREKEIDRMKSEFVSTVSHELRTPLSSIKNVISNILAGVTGKIDGRLKDYIEMANEDTSRLSRLIENLLDLSKIEAGKMEFKKGPIDLADVIKSITPSLKDQADTKHISIITSISKGLPKAYADADKIEQVLVNLIGNAIKFTPEGGTITVGAKKPDDSLEVSVADTGMGISFDNLPKLFDRFQQFDRPSGGAGAKGTGLGLSISKGIVEAHNGKIWAESGLGKGTKFTFTLPLYTSETVLLEAIDNKIAEARKKYKEFSVCIVKLNNYSQVEEIFGENKAQEIFLKIFQSIKNLLRDEDFANVKGKDEIVALAEVGGRDALKMEARLRGVIRKFISEAAQKIEIDFSCGHSTYPDDEKSAKKLLENAETKLALAKEKKLKKNILIVDDEPVM